MTGLIHFDYAKSSASYRVRIALNLKGLEADRRTVSLLDKEQRAPDYLAKNPAGLVPVLQDGERPLSQSLAIIEYLDETHGEPPLLPVSPLDRAYVRAMALDIACDIHPLNNLRVLNYLKNTLAIDDDTKNVWYAHWIALGFSAFETKLTNDGKSGRFCFGDTPTLADICLVPQAFNARRFNCDMDPYPEINRILENCDEIAAFSDAHPDKQ